MKLFGKREKKNISLTFDLNSPLPEKISLQVEGLEENQLSIAALAQPNPNHDYGKSDLIDRRLIDRRIYQYHYITEPIELTSDTENDHLDVVVNGHKIGYLNQKNSTAVRTLKSENKIKGMELSLGGGRYKCVISNFSPNNGTTYEYEKNNAEYYATLSIRLYK